MNYDVELCKSIAYRAHKGQADKADKPYINHPRYVADHCQTQKEKCVAWLHDVLEDTTLTTEDLLSFGVDAKIVETARTLSHDKSVSYFT